MAALGTLGMPAFARAHQVGPIGLQLFTVRDLFAADPVDTLKKVAAIGYREVEFGGGNYTAMDQNMLRDALARFGLTAPSLHIPIELLSSDFGAAEKIMNALGAKTIILPWLSEDYRSEAAFAKLIPQINRIAGQARDAGLGFAYHNHDFEFLIPGHGTSLYDRLVADTDPALVGFELDLYWAAHAGVDVAKLIDRLSDRLFAFHVKDMKKDGSMAPVGTGTIDFARLFALPGASGVEHFYVENDQAPAPYIPDITTSFRNLRALRW